MHKNPRYESPNRQAQNDSIKRYLADMPSSIKTLKMNATLTKNKE